MNGLTEERASSPLTRARSASDTDSKQRLIGPGKHAVLTFKTTRARVLFLWAIPLAAVRHKSAVRGSRLLWRGAMPGRQATKWMDSPD
jgi:hypothetical protein